MSHCGLLSTRATENVNEGDHWTPLVNALSNPYSNDNPGGTVIMGLAENSMMHDEVSHHIKRNFEVDKASHFTYGNGPQGSLRLRKALAGFFNDRFKALQPTQAEDLLITSGVSGMIDSLTWCLCNEGEGVLFPRPLYTGFRNDVPTRSRGKLVPVSFARQNGSIVLDDVFDARRSVQCFEKALEQSEMDGVKIRAVMITNPHNPLGKCYPVDTIKAIAVFCEKHNLHYLSDEIYAMSTFENQSYLEATKFHSVLSLDLSDQISSDKVHVLYGASKDFCVNGLRVGSFYTRNDRLRLAMLSILPFAWEAYIVQDMWARMLEDREWLDGFITENQRHLAERYKTLTTTLQNHGIPYFEGGNAGLFLMVDLRRYFEDKADVMTREAEITANCLEKGAMVAKGSNFLAEEIGWFRVTFTPAEGAFETGLSRILETLSELD